MAKYGTGTCSVCGRTIRVLKNGTIGMHNWRKRNTWYDGRSDRCDGWGKKPKETPITATLIVSRSYSTCSNCGDEVLPDKASHHVTSGWQGGKPGCGATFTAITSDTTHLDAYWRERLAEMGPDLPIVEYGKES